MPGASDDVTLSLDFAVGLAGQNAEINSIVTTAGNPLSIASGIELKIDSNPPTNPPPGLPASPVPGSNYFGGAVTVTGRINANTTTGGTNVIFAGGTSIGPGDLNGNLDAGPNSTFRFAGGVNTFLAGATLGPGTGTVIIAATVTINGSLQDNTETLQIAPGGNLTGPGNLDENAILNWQGGIISVAGGTTIETPGEMLGAGSGDKFLTSSLTNLSASSRLDGSGTLYLTYPGLSGAGSLDNAAGTLELSLPSIAGASASSFTNSALGTIQETAAASAPTVISAPFTNNGNLNVSSGAALTLSVASGAPTDVLDGVLQLSGNLRLLGSVTSVHGFSEMAAPGFLLVGGGLGGANGSLTVPASVIDTLSGNLEVTATGLLTGGGQVYNAGRLQLDKGSSTAGLGSYVQTSIGTLALDVAPGMMGGMGAPGQLVVTGNAQLSGTLILLNYTPSVGAQFTVVRAGSVTRHFDTIPHGMSETDGPTSVTVTQN